MTKYTKATYKKLYKQSDNAEESRTQNGLFVGSPNEWGSRAWKYSLHLTSNPEIQESRKGFNRPKTQQP